MQEELEGQGSLPLDYTVLLGDTALSTALPDLASSIRNQPEATLNQMALALHTVSFIMEYSRPKSNLEHLHGSMCEKNS